METDRFGKQLIIVVFSLTATFGFSQIQEIVEVELVEVYVSALDSEENPIEDLTEKDFVLKEDGVEQSITYFTRLLDPDSQIPLTIAFLLDTSGSMHRGTEKLRRIDIAKTFASLFLKEVKPNDQMRVFAFDNIYRALTPMTSDPEIINQTLSKVTIDPDASPGTALLFSVDLTINQLKQYPGRRILIVCSDGQNNIAGPDPDVLVESLKRQDITLLSLATVNNLESRQVSDVNFITTEDQSIASMNVRRVTPSEVKEARKLMTKLAEETGGYAFFPEDASKLGSAIEKLRSVIRSQYALAYKPKPHSGKSWRKIEVKCKRKGAKLRYRQGYFMD